MKNFKRDNITSILLSSYWRLCIYGGLKTLSSYKVWTLVNLENYLEFVNGVELREGRKKIANGSQTSIVTTKEHLLLDKRSLLSYKIKVKDMAEGSLRNKSGNLGIIFCAQTRQKTQA